MKMSIFNGWRTRSEKRIWEEIKRHDDLIRQVRKLAPRKNEPEYVVEALKLAEERRKRRVSAGQAVAAMLSACVALTASILSYSLAESAFKEAKANREQSDSDAKRKDARSAEETRRNEQSAYVKLLAERQRDIFGRNLDIETWKAIFGLLGPQKTGAEFAQAALEAGKKEILKPNPGPVSAGKAQERVRSSSSVASGGQKPGGALSGLLIFPQCQSDLLKNLKAKVDPALQALGGQPQPWQALTRFKGNEVRYYYDFDREAAKKVAETIMVAVPGTQVRVLKVQDPRYAKQARTGLIEIWLGSPA